MKKNLNSHPYLRFLTDARMDLSHRIVKIRRNIFFLTYSYTLDHSYDNKLPTYLLQDLTSQKIDCTAISNGGRRARKNGNGFRDSESIVLKSKKSEEFEGGVSGSRYLLLFNPT